MPLSAPLVVLEHPTAVGDLCAAAARADEGSARKTAGAAVRALAALTKSGGEEAKRVALDKVRWRARV